MLFFVRKNDEAREKTRFHNTIANMIGRVDVAIMYIIFSSYSTYLICVLFLANYATSQISQKKPQLASYIMPSV